MAISGGKILIIVVILIVLFVIVGSIIGVVIWILVSQNTQKCGTTPLAQACTIGTDCQSCTCSSNFCQLTDQNTGQIGAACVVLGPGAGCNSGLSCDPQSLTCQVSSCQGTIANGLSCQGSATNCSSCNCSLGYCQNSGQISGTVNSACNVSGARCGTGLTCAGGVCQQSGTTLTQNGFQCTTDNECQSNNCVSSAVNSNLYCQPKNIIESGVQDASCSPATNGSPCAQGLSCDASVCVVNTNGLPLTANCTNNVNGCNINMTCNNLLSANTTQSYCGYPLISPNATLPITSSQPGCPAGMLNSNNICVNVQNINSSTPGGMCTLGAQCQNGTCQLTDPNWAIWRSNISSLNQPSWSPIGMWPGPVEKMMIASSGQNDVVYALVGGNNAGLYRYDILSNTLSLVINKGVQGCNLLIGAQLVNFCVSRDNAIIYIAVAGLKGTYIDMTIGATGQTYSNVDYTGIFQITVTTGLIVCQSYPLAPPWMNVQGAPGMIFGPYGNLTASATGSAVNPINCTVQNNSYQWNAIWPVEIIIDMDCTDNFNNNPSPNVPSYSLCLLAKLNNTTIKNANQPLTNNMVYMTAPPWIIRCGAANCPYPQQPGCNGYTAPVFTWGLPPGLAGYPNGLFGGLGFSALPYCPNTDPNGSTGCSITQSSCTNISGPPNNYQSGLTGGTSTNPRLGWCTRMSNKLIRNINNMSYNDSYIQPPIQYDGQNTNHYSPFPSAEVMINSPTPATNNAWQSVRNFLLMDGVYGQILSNSFSNQAQGINFATSSASSNLISTNPTNNLSTSLFINGNGYIFDFDAYNTSSDNLQVILYYQDVNGEMHIAYTPNATWTNNSTPLVDLATYVPKSGVVGISNSYVYFSGPGYCSNNIIKPQSTSS